MEKTIFVCEDSVDGIFTGIYEGWASKLGHDNIKLAVEGLGTMELFASYRIVRPDEEKAGKVARTLMRRFGNEIYDQLCFALLAPDEEKANAVYHTIVAGFSLANERQVMEHLSHPQVFKTFELTRKTGHESHLLTGFVRFQELAGGILFSQITPKCNVLTILGSHFADRLPMENWMIHDKGRNLFLVHEAGKPWAVVSGVSIPAEMLSEYSEDEKEFQRLWRGFCKSISIKERENPQLQRQNLPMRFRKNMVEFQDDEA